MELILSTGSVHTVPLEDQFRLASDAGFQGMEYVVNRHHGDKVGRRLEELSTEYDLPIRNLHAPFEPVPGWGNQVECLLRTVALATGLGARSITFHPPHRSMEDVAFFRWMDEIEDFQSQVGQGRVLMTLENMPRVRQWRGIKVPFVTMPYRFQSRDELWQLLEERNLGLTFDTTHFGTGKDNLAACLAQFRDRISTVHLSNFRAKDFQEHLPVETGDLDLDDFVARLARAEFDGLVTYEVFPHFLGEKREDMAASLRRLVDWFGRCRGPSSDGPAGIRSRSTAVPEPRESA